MAEPLSSSAAAGPSASPPPNGGPPVQEDFVYSASQARATVAFGAIVTIITTVSVIARLYTHKFVTRRVRVDDAWALLALLCVIAVNTMQSVFTMRYLPEMTSMISNNAGSRIPYATAITYNLAMASLKMTFLFQFYQIFRNVRVMRIVYMVAIFVVGAWSITQILLAVLVCVPIQANWSLDVKGVVCLPTFVSTYINATGTMVTDVIVLFLPFPTLWSLKLRGRQIWAVFGVFGIGAIVPIISAGRIWSLGHAPPKGYMSTSCWTIAEIGIGVTTASLATIRHLRDRRVNSLLSRSLPTNRRDSFTEGVMSQDPAQQFSHQRSGSEVDLIGVNRTGTSGSLDSNFKLFGKKKGLPPSALGAQDDQTDLTLNNKGSTKVNITSFRRKKEMPMSEGAANFLGEFGIVVERTWEVQEIRME
ncbi:integral membrane protein [Colletotrichum kahawae]|uniref:Integral membrane protein n=1 Tax=Colletotrichum kahawae TaxID=34407 RepID=A0AAD9YGY5_COLKA|nr:integral membrane protein [Colletotrichum kahawae]